MNTTIKHKFIPRVLAALLFFSASIPSFGQEFIRGAIDYLICDTSIVRGTALDTVLVYNRKNTSTFMLVAASDLYAHSIYIEPIYVNDFEIYKNSVYFCGYIKENNVKRAVVGLFDLDLFPNSNIYYYKLDDLFELRKLDVYTIEDIQGFEEVHLVATGSENGSRMNVLIDMRMFPPNPVSCCIYFSESENENYDDVAVTKKYIAVSARNKVQGNPVVDLLYFKKPSHTWQHIFSFNVNIFHTGSPSPESPIILEYTKDDSIAAVYKITGFYQMAMLRLEALVDSYEIFEILEDTTETVYPIDIKYNDRNSVYSILAQAKSFLSDPAMQIYHVTPEDLNGLTMAGQGKKYTDLLYMLWSLDFWLGSNKQFVVSGGTGEIPHLFRFNHTQEHACSEAFVYPYHSGNRKGQFEDRPLYSYLLQLTRLTQETRYIPMKFPVKCAK